MQASKQAERASGRRRAATGDVAEFNGLLNRVAAGYLSAGFRKVYTKLS